VGDAPAEATTVSVDSISYVTEGGKNGDKHLSVTVAILNNLGGQPNGASISITMTNSTSGNIWTGTATTGTTGTVTFTLKNAPTGSYSTIVDNVTADGLIWEDQSTPDNGISKSSAANAAVTLETGTPQTKNSSGSTPVLFVMDTTESAETDSADDETASDDVVLSLVAIADWNPEEKDETAEDDATENTEPVAASSQDLDELFTGLPSDELLVDVI
jgi:hypothetical protein